MNAASIANGNGASRRDGANHPAVLLVSMPFGPVMWPSLGLGLLQAGLAERGVSSRARYFTIPFAEAIGERLYSTIALSGKLGLRHLAGEWIFSGALSDPTEADVERYVVEILRERDGVPDVLVRRLLDARKRVDLFLRHATEKVLGERPAMVGFTSVFQQHAASLALAKRLKRARPELFIVMGGANCEGVMGAETLRQFEFVDAVVSGEGDRVFPELVSRVLASEPVGALEGVRTRERLDQEFESGRFPSACPVRPLDELPYPDFRDYFEQFAQSRFAEDWTPDLLFESSRGCWWGERHHCTFCGLNGTSMAYRSKAAERSLAELSWLGAQHPGSDIQVVDNILDLGYFKTLLPELVRRKLDFGLFYETKANLKKEQVRLLRAAGVREIQPGIESLSDEVLKLMRKGVSALQNVQLLKWCRQYGVDPYWNLLWGFPGEPEAEYERMASVAPLLTHLPPPRGFGGLRLDRFSPNFDDARALGFAEVAPFPAYAHVYALPAAALENLAYYFRFGYFDARDPQSYTAALQREIERWRRVARRSDLFSVDLGGRLLVWDFRPVRHAPLAVLEGLDRRLLLGCDAIADAASLARDAAAPGERPLPLEAIERRLEFLVSAGFMLQDGARYLALPIPLGDYAPRAEIVERFDAVVARLGRRIRGGWRIAVAAGELRGGRSDAGRAPRGARPRVSRGQRDLLRPEHFEWLGSGELVVRTRGSRPTFTSTGRSV